MRKNIRVAKGAGCPPRWGDTSVGLTAWRAASWPAAPLLSVRRSGGASVMRQEVEITVVSMRLVSSLDDVGGTASWGVGGVRAEFRVVREMLISEYDLIGEGLGVSATSL